MVSNGENALYGKSGCKLEIVNKNFDFFVKKTSCSIPYNQRLFLQAQKQTNFFKQDRHARIKTPEIISVFDGGYTDLSFIEMKYIIGANALPFLSVCDIGNVNGFIESILSYLNDIISTSVSLVGDNVTILDKVEKLKIVNFPDKDKVMSILSALPTELFFEGDCHGDLTLSNMIFTPKILYVIDFLDTFVESPILDLIKLRQDTKHLWSCFLSGSYSCRIIETLKYIDETIEKKYDGIIKTDWYRYLSIMNYVRIYPYVKENNEIEFLQNCIKHYL